MSRPIITCASCGERRSHKGRGWCARCYRRWLYAGKPESGPPKEKVIPCGTVQGWDKHMREKTPPCDGCRAAHNKAVLDHYHDVGKHRRLGQAKTATPERWTAEERHVAGLAAVFSKDVEDRRELLEALGLIPDREAQARTA